MTILIELPPIQAPISSESILRMLSLQPRRTRLATEWPRCLYEPEAEGKNWRLVLPFCETLANAFHTMCDVPGGGMSAVRNDRCLAFLDDAREKPETLSKVRQWLGQVGSFVAIRDCLALSFALDYERENGDPARPQTRVGSLRSRAKPYDRKATSDTRKATGELAAECLRFLQVVTCYEKATCVVAMPPSSPDKTYDLPTELVAVIAKQWDKPDLSAAVSTKQARLQLKNVPLAEKLSVLGGTIAVEPGSFKKASVLLVDDLYQSGVTMNYVAMQLLEAGASKVFGLACEKTCRNDDNVGGGRDGTR